MFHPFGILAILMVLAAIYAKILPRTVEQVYFDTCRAYANIFLDDVVYQHDLLQYDSPRKGYAELEPSLQRLQYLFAASAAVFLILGVSSNAFRKPEDIAVHLSAAVIIIGLPYYAYRRFTQKSGSGNGRVFINIFAMTIRRRIAIFFRGAIISLFHCVLMLLFFVFSTAAVTSALQPLF